MSISHLCRGKQVYNKEWIEGYFYINDYETTSRIISLTRNKILQYGYEVYYDTVGLFTGLYDSTEWENSNENDRKYAMKIAKDNRTSPEKEWKGIRIFENDIMGMIDWWYEGDYKEKGFIGIVTYEDGSFVVKSKDGTKRIPLNACSINNFDLKVIGNVDDNSELLE